MHLHRPAFSGRAPGNASRFCWVCPPSPSVSVLTRAPLLQTSVSGRAPGNTAAIQQNLAVCGSQVYVIDKASQGAHVAASETIDLLVTSSSGGVGGREAGWAARPGVRAVARHPSHLSRPSRTFQARKLIASLPVPAITGAGAL